MESELVAGPSDLRGEKRTRVDFIIAPRVTARKCVSLTMGQLIPCGKFAHLDILTAGSRL